MTILKFCVLSIFFVPLYSFYLVYKYLGFFLEKLCEFIAFFMVLYSFYVGFTKSYMDAIISMILAFIIGFALPRILVFTVRVCMKTHMRLEKYWYTITHRRRFVSFKSKEPKTHTFRKKNKKEKKATIPPVETSNGNVSFFSDIKDSVSLKKRFRELIKIYHPDNQCGNDDLIKRITEEYMILKEKYKEQKT